MWTVYKKDGTAAGCTVWSLEYHGERMGERYVSADIESAEPLSLGVGDWIEYRGERFTLGSAVDISKSAPSGAYGSGFTCKGVRFISLSDELTRCSFLDIVGGDNKMHYTGLPKFSFFCATVDDFARRIQANLDRAYTGDGKWTVVCDPSLAEKGNVSLSADGKTVWEMLSELPDKFGCNFTVSGRTLTIGVKPVEAGKVFMWGKDGGLDGVDVSGDNSQQVITRVRVYGSTKNMPERYYNKMSGADGKKYVPDNMAVSTLMLPSFPKTTLDPYIDSGNIGELGVREGVVYFDGSGDNEEIYPTMEGMTAEDLRAAGVSISLDEGDNGNLDEVFAADAVEADGYVAQGQTVSPSTFRITLKDIGFDINGQLTSSTAKISMKDGMCGGREFEITGCAKSGNKYVLTCKRTLDSDLDLYFPYKDYNVKAGDKFVLLDISMPEAYIQAASGRLLLKGTEWLAKNCEPKRTVTPKIYGIYMARQHDEALKSGGVSLHNTLREGMLLHVKDDDLGIDTVIGIKTLTIKEGGDKTVPEYEVTLDDDDDTGTISRMQERIDGIVSGVIKISGETVIKNSPWLKSALAGKLSRTDDDTAGGVITFRKGLKVGDGSRGVDAAGNAVLKGVSSETVSNSGNITNGGDIENRNGRATTKDLTVTDAASVRSLTVTGKATFFELEVQRASAAGGLCIYSAGAGKIDLVEPVYDTQDTTKVKGWKCYQLAKDADGNMVQQTLKAGDNVVSFTFNTGAGNWDGAANRWWWRRVTATTFPPTLKADGQRYFSFTLSKSLCAEGSDEPKVGDRLMVLGNKDDASRQNAIVICAHKGLDAGLTAPYMAQYVGINDFDLASHRESWWGYDADHKASNHFTGKFSISGSSGSTPIVRDRGAWKAGVSYDYYDRVSYNGSLYLMTNKAAGTTTGVPGVSTDWTLQVSAGTNGNDGASISIKGSAIAHYANASEIDLATAKSGYYLTDTGSSEQHKRGITIVAGGMIVNDIDVSDGDSYTTSEDGHLWTANAGKEAWDDCGKIEGAKGADAVVWRLIPYSESLSGAIVKGEASDGTAYKSYHIKGTLLYTAEKWEGTTRTRVSLGDDVFWRWKTAKGTAWNNVKTAESAMPDWIYNKDANDPSTAAEDKSLYAVVELVVGGAVADRRTVNAITDAKAYMDVDADLGRMEFGVKRLSESVLKIEDDTASLSSRMGKAEARVETSVQYDPETGKVISKVTLSADRIDLEGAVSANKEFRIDTWGNVMTGVALSPSADAVSYIVEDKSNLVLEDNVTIKLPNDPEYIGRRMLIMAQPKHNSAGAVLKPGTNDPVTAMTQAGKITILTGRTLNRWIYGYNNGASIYTSANDTSDADAVKSALEGLQFFGGNVVSESGGSFVQPWEISIQCGYIELLGIPYAVSNMYAAEYAVKGGEKYAVHMTRSDDGLIDDSDTANGIMDVTPLAEADSPAFGQEGSPWREVPQLCQWVVINVNAQQFGKLA